MNPQSPSAFNRKKSSGDGLQSWCRACQSENNARHRDKILERTRERRAAQREQTRNYNRLYRAMREGRIFKEPCHDCRDFETFPYIDGGEIKWYCSLCRPNRSGGHGSKNFRRIIVDFGPD